MAQFLVTELASADQTAILNDLREKAGMSVAMGYRSQFKSLFDRLMEHPASGAPRPGLGRDIRIGVVAPYVVIYRHDAVGDTVAVLRIVHGRRDITGKLLRRRR